MPTALREPKGGIDAKRPKTASGRIVPDRMGERSIARAIRLRVSVTSGSPNRR
jgi:hypothetical protein